MYKWVNIKEKWIDIKGSSAILFWVFNGTSILSHIVRQLLIISIVLGVVIGIEILVMSFVDHTVTFLENHWTHERT